MVGSKSVFNLMYGVQHCSVVATAYEQAYTAGSHLRVFVSQIHYCLSDGYYAGFARLGIEIIMTASPVLAAGINNVI